MTDVDMRSHRPLARLESWQGKLVGGELEVAHKHRGRQNLDAGVAEPVGRHRLVDNDREGVGRPGFQFHAVLQADAVAERPDLFHPFCVDESHMVILSVRKSHGCSQCLQEFVHIGTGYMEAD